MDSETTNGEERAVEGEEKGLTRVQRKFLRKCRRDPKPLAVMLSECQVGMETFAEWRREGAFRRAFREATAGLTQDAMTDLRFTFALCGRIISSEVAGIQKELGKRKKEAKGGEVASGQQQKEEPKQGEPQQEQKEGKKGGGPQGDEGKREELDRGVSRFCFEVIKVGMGVFVPKRGKGRRRAFPRVDPRLYARLQKAQEEKDEG